MLEQRHSIRTGPAPAIDWPPNDDEPSPWFARRVRPTWFMDAPVELLTSSDLRIESARIRSRLRREPRLPPWPSRRVRELDVALAVRR